MTEYAKLSNVQHCIYDPQTGHPCNHHILEDGKLGERVKPEEAECVIITTCVVIDLRSK